MGLQNILAAKVREDKGGNKVDRLRRQGLLPAVFYGPGEASQMLTLDYKAFKTAFMAGEGNRSLFTLDIEGQGSKMVLLKEYQVDPLKRTVRHADFLKIDPETPVALKVPLVLAGKPVGVEKGGQLQQMEREVTISAKPADLPAQIEADVTKVALGHSLRLSEIPMPAGVKLVYIADASVAAVVPPKGVKLDEAGEEAGKTAAAPAKAAAKPAKK